MSSAEGERCFGALGVGNPTKSMFTFTYINTPDHPPPVRRKLAGEVQTEHRIRRAKVDYEGGGITAPSDGKPFS